MKIKSILTVLALAFAGLTMGQEDMPPQWESRLGHKMDFVGTGDEGDVSYAATQKEITVFKNDDGSVAWTGKFKEIAPNLRKIDELIPFWESNTIFLFDRQTGKDQVSCVDLHTGKELWNTDKYKDLYEEVIVYMPEMDAFAISGKKSLTFVKARTGEEMWETDKFIGTVGQYIYESTSKTAVMVNFIPSGLVSFFTGFKNQIIKVDLTNGNILWEATYHGRADRKVISKEFVFDLDLVEDKIFLRLGGLQVYDFNTGAKLWNAAFDYTPDVVKAPPHAKKFGIYGAVADPVIVGNDVYILDLTNKRNQYVKKYDLNTGKLLWTSTEIKGARAIPSMAVVDDKIVLQIGGVVEAQVYTEKKTSDGIETMTRIWYPNIKPCGVQAFNVSDGSLAWDSEKFKRGITNMIADDENIYIGSGKALYSVNYATGEVKYEVNIKSNGLGLANTILTHKGNLVIVFDKGVALHNMADGKMIKSGKYKKSSLEDVYGDILMMKTSKSDIAAFDLNTCTYKQFKAKRGSATHLRDDGRFIYVYEKKDITKLRTL